MAGNRNWRAPRRGLGQHYWDGRSSGVVITRDGMGAAPRRRAFPVASRGKPVRSYPVTFTNIQGVSGLGMMTGGTVHPLGMVVGAVLSFFVGRWVGNKWGKSKDSGRNWGLIAAGASVGTAALSNKRSTGSYFPVGLATAVESALPGGSPTPMPMAMSLPAPAAPTANGSPAVAVAAPVMERPNGAPPLPQDFFTSPGDALGPLRSAMYGLRQAGDEFGGDLPEDQIVRYQALIEEALPAARASSDPAAAPLVADAERTVFNLAQMLDVDEGTGWYER